MKTSLKYFMWGYQQLFQYSIQYYAKTIFQELSNNIEPSVFLLGILRRPAEGYYPICIEPEECGIDVESFKEVDKLADSIHNNDPRKNVMHTNEHQHKRYHEDLKVECLRNAIKQLVDKNFEGKGKISFISRPVIFENYEIFLVLQFDEEIYRKFYSLTKSVVKDNEVTTTTIRRSLIDALVYFYLEEVRDCLYRPRPGVYFDEIKTSVKDILRIAAENFVNTAVSAANGSRETYDLFDICNYISSLNYEGGPSIGKLLICKEEHPNINIRIRLTKPIQLKDRKKVRKLLEIASDKLYLYTNGDYIVGFAELKGQYNSSDENLFIINFIGAHKWELIHDIHKMMAVEYNNPVIPKSKIDLTNFNTTLKRIFSVISDNNTNSLREIVDSATEQKHGTLIVISNKAKEEAKRLENQSTNIESVVLDRELVKSITSIDGAIILDTQGVCHCMGVILDGVASLNGNSARGARYNSAIRYVDGHKGECVAIIISEDGMVDLYPQLRPQIRKIDIKNYLELLRRDVELEKVDYDKFRTIMNWFEAHEFYLSKEVCEEINKLKKEFNSKLDMEVGAIYIQYRDYKPNSEMDDSYFLPEER